MKNLLKAPGELSNLISVLGTLIEVKKTEPASTRMHIPGQKTILVEENCTSNILKVPRCSKTTSYHGIRSKVHSN